MTCVGSRIVCYLRIAHDVLLNANSLVRIIITIIIINFLWAPCVVISKTPIIFIFGGERRERNRTASRHKRFLAEGNLFARRRVPLNLTRTF